MSGADTADPATSAPPHPPPAAHEGPQTHDRPAFVTPRDFLEQGRPKLPRVQTAADREQLDGLAQNSLHDRWCQTNPVPLLEKRQVLDILETVV